MSSLQVWFDEKYAGTYGDSHAVIGGVSVAGTAAVETTKKLETPWGDQAITFKGVITSSLPVQVAGYDAYPNGKGNLLSGSVSEQGTSFDKAGFSFDVDGAWNTVKNAKATSDGAEKLTFKDFVDVAIALGDSKLPSDSQFASSDITIENAKRATVSTGQGDDTIRISTVTNNVDVKNGLTNSWYDIHAGKGADIILFTKGSVESANDGATKNLTLTAGNGNADGARSWAKIDFGDDSNIDILKFEAGMKLKDVALAHYKAGDHVYVGNVEVIFDGSGHATGTDFGWIHLI